MDLIGDSQGEVLGCPVVRFAPPGDLPWVDPEPVRAERGPESPEVADRGLGLAAALGLGVRDDLQQVPPVVLQMLFGHVVEADRGAGGGSLRIKPGQEPVRRGEGVADRADAPRVFPGRQRAGQHRVEQFLGHEPVPDRDRGEVQLPGRAVLLEHCRSQGPAVMLEPCGQRQVGARS